MHRPFLSSLAGGAIGIASVFGAASFDAPGNFNPVVPGYFADPTIKQFGELFHLYATTDGNGGGRGPAVAWVSRDFVNWVLVPMNWPAAPHYWAPDVLERPDGRYYLFYNQPCNTFAGVSDTPVGPWTPLTPGDGLVIRDRLVKEVITLDTQCFEDKDGTLYGYWGTWGIFPNSGCGFGVFQPDLKSFARLGMIPNTQAKDFFEAPFMLERNGVYYLTYSSGSCHDASYRVQYAVSDRPDGTFTMGPNNPILATSPDGTVHGPGHHSILRRGDAYFILYHRHDLPVTPNGMHRQVCADRLVFERDGVIRKVEATHDGVGYLGPRARPANLAFGRPVSASSHYRDTLRHHEYKPAYAVDDNNGTLWRPADNRPGHWLQVDLGEPQRVRRVETQFEYGTWAYQYLLETSTDGRAWTLFADRRANTRWGSPMVDDGDVEARFLRITVTGTGYPGLFGALWNLKAFAEAPADPLLAMADRGFGALAGVKPASNPPPPGPMRPPEADGQLRPLIQLEAAGLPLGAPVEAWANQGTLGGEFRSGDERPLVDLAAGCKSVRFSGRQVLTGSFPAPRSLSGNSSYTVAAWVLNPVVAESECFLSWAGRGGPDATTAQFGYGTQRDFGAVGHWGFADMGFRGEPPLAGQWQHLAVVFDGVIERVYVNGQINQAEPKMLLMHAGRPVHVGASEPGTEHFDGYVASLRVYDVPLSESQVGELAAQTPAADVWVHLDSAQLEYGPLPSWTNQGAWRGTFEAVAPAGNDPRPVVEDVHGRIAVRFAPGQSLELTPANTPVPDRFTLLVSLANPSLEPGEHALEFVDEAGGRFPVLAEPPAAGWQQLALVATGGGAALFTNGAPALAAPTPLPKSLKTVRLGGARGFSGALGRVQLFRRALSPEDMAQLHALWKSEWSGPAPDPAGFLDMPVALDPTVIAMTAQPARAGFGPAEYRFTETTGRRGGHSSGWTTQPFFLDDGLDPGGRPSYSLKVRDRMGNVTAPSAPATAAMDPTVFRVFEDDFDGAREFVLQGTAGTLWDGFLGAADHSAPESIRCTNGVLRLQSRGTVWDGGEPRGAFLYKLVSGDFVVQTEVADYDGLATRRVPGNNDGGVMVRVPRIADAGPGEDLVQLNFFPIWNQGNMITTLDGGRSQKGNLLAWEAHRHLQIIRHGTWFHFRTSADGRRWQAMPGSPVARPDMAGLPVEVGLYHASYGAESSFVSFQRFRLTTR